MILFSIGAPIINVCFSIGPPTNRVPLQELIRQYSLTDEQLNSEIDYPDFPCLAKYFDGVTIYSNAMGLTRAEQADVNALCLREGTQAAMIKCLHFWRTHNPYAATYRPLLDLLLELRKERIADEICQHLTQCEYRIYLIKRPSRLNTHGKSCLVNKRPS